MLGIDKRNHIHKRIHIQILIHIHTYTKTITYTYGRYAVDRTRAHIHTYMLYSIIRTTQSGVVRSMRSDKNAAGTNQSPIDRDLKHS